MKYLVLLLLLSLPLYAKPKSRHARSDARDKRLIPSDDSLIQQNAWIDEFKLERYSDARSLRSAVERHELVLVRVPFLQVDSRLPQDRRYLRPWVIPWLAELSEEYYQTFHTRLVLSSAVRPVSVQRRLIKRNLAAAPWKGPLESSHVAGSTFDLSRAHMTREQTKWVEGYLDLHVIYWGDILVEEERACFHIMIRPEKQ
jgi:hypothetical protein